MTTKTETPVDTETKKKEKKSKKVRVKFKAFELSTPLMVNNMDYPGAYNSQLIDLLLKNVMKLDKDKRKYKNDELTFNLLEYTQSDRIHIMKGIFSTARHGEVKQTINVETQEEIIEKEIQPIEGVKNEINFTLDKRNGLLLIQEDKVNHVISRSVIKSFIYHHRKLIYPYIDEFNKVNSGSGINAVISKRSFYTLTTLPPIDFFEKLKEFTSIKSGILYVNTSQHSKPTDVLEAFEQELVDNDIKDVDLEIKIKNKSPFAMIKTFEKYFKRVKELQRYDSYAIEGVTKTGAVQKITPDTFTREFECLLEKNSKGLINDVKMIEEMQDIIDSTENPLANKNKKLPSDYLIKDVDNVQTEIDEIIGETNKSKEENHQESEAK